MMRKTLVATSCRDGRPVLAAIAVGGLLFRHIEPPAPGAAPDTLQESTS